MSLISTYDRKTGLYGDDSMFTELEILHLWYRLTKHLQLTTIVECGIYKGLSTCFLAAALRDMKNGGKVYAIDPWELPHLWQGSDLDQFIRWIKKPTQETLCELPNWIDLLVLDSIHTYDQASWELQTQPSNNDLLK